MPKPLRRMQECKDAYKILHAAGWSGAAIARVLDIADNTVRRWQTEQGLTANSTQFSPKFNHAVAMAMYEDGASDGDIARHFGATQSGATRWRQRRGLEPNVKPSTLPALSDERRRKARRLLREGATREQVATAVGCSRRTVTKLRKAIAGDERLRGTGVPLTGVRNAARRNAQQILAELMAATRHVTDATIRDDTIGDMFLAIMEGRLDRQNIKTEARGYSGRAIDQWQSRWAPVSIDEDLTGEGFRLVDLIACPQADAWRESVGA